MRETKRLRKARSELLELKNKKQSLSLDIRLTSEFIVSQVQKITLNFLTLENIHIRMNFIALEIFC